MNLYIFNPSSDLALAAGEQSYTPPKRIDEYEKRLALLPALYAEDKSAILIPDNINIFELPYAKLAKKKDTTLMHISEIKSNDFIVKPWGWNLSLLNKLRKSGFCSPLPDKTIIEELRNLSHRRTAIKINEYIYQRLDEEPILPMEFFDVHEALTYINKVGNSYIKLPWSSSGRGVLRVDNPQCENVRRRVVDAINNQGSVLIERAWSKRLDFATEWTCENGQVNFCGYSVFRTDGLANYKGNLIASQNRLRNMIFDISNSRWQEDVWLQVISDALCETIASKYSGPLGVDMLIDDNGNINPCVEINLRMTMGHVAIGITKHTSEEFWFTPGFDIW